MCKSAVSSGVCRANLSYQLYILHVPGNLESKSSFQQRFQSTLIVVCVPETHLWEHNYVHGGKFGKIIEEKTRVPSFCIIKLRSSVAPRNFFVHLFSNWTALSTITYTNVVQIELWKSWVHLDFNLKINRSNSNVSNLFTGSPSSKC